MKTELSVRSQRLELRRLTGADVGERYLSWLADPETTRFLEARFGTHTLASTREWVEEMNSHPGTWLLAIVDLEGDSGHIGNIKVGPLDRHHGTADVGIMLGEPSARGRGLGTEAIRLAGELILSQPQVRKLTASCYSGNAASSNAFIAAGWEAEGVRPAQFVDEDGNLHDQVMFGLRR